MRDEYDFSNGVRGVTSRRYARGRNTVTVTTGTRKRQGNRANDDQWSQSVYEFVQDLKDAPQSSTLFNPWYDTDRLRDLPALPLYPEPAKLGRPLVLCA